MQDGLFDTRLCRSGEQVISCNRCAGLPVATVRRAIASLLEGEPQRSFTIRELFSLAAVAGDLCHRCHLMQLLSLQMYGLRQDGIAERVSCGRYRFRKGDDSTRDFIYARRERKLG
jgi:hypothetical protein